MSWLAVPVYLLRALASNIGALTAEETLTARLAVALGSGTLKKDASEKIERDLVRIAESARTRRPRRPTVLDFERDAAELGLTIEKVRA